MAIERRGPFWDVIEGRLPAPPAAQLLGRLGPAAAALLGGEAFARTLLKASFLRPARPGTLYGDGRVVIPFQALRSSA